MDRRGLLRKADLLLRTGDYRAALDTYAVVARSFASEGFSLKALAVWKQVREILRRHTPDRVELDMEARDALVALYRSLGLENDAKAIETSSESDPGLN